jgi:hypothetical protein
MFGHVHGIVSGFDKPLEVKVLSEFSQTDADRDVFESGVFDRGSDSVRDSQRLIDGGTNEQGGKFISPVSVTGVYIVSDRMLDNFADLF